MWMEETTGSRINVARTEQALAVQPSIIGTGCPYCLTTISDGTKAKEVEEKVQTLDDRDFRTICYRTEKEAM